MTGFEPRTSVQKRPLYQLSHNHCPGKVLCSHVAVTYKENIYGIDPCSTLIVIVHYYPQPFKSPSTHKGL